ncbi:MAG: ATP-binding cassette domain-containing protein [Pseudonocardia sp.]
MWEPAGELGLIGVDDLVLPYWAEVDQSVAESSTWMLVRSVPRIVAAVVAQAWRIAPRLTTLAGLLQLASGVASAFGLLATAGVLTQLLEAEQVVRTLRALAWVVASYAARGLLETATGAVEGQLAPLVEQAAQDHLHAALAEVELIAFDDPGFTELVNKGTQALSHLRSAASSIGDLLAALVALAAAVVTAGLLHPLLAHLSGGQWQRISVARALYRDAPLVIADEPTAALDARAEHAVFTTLRALPTTTRHPTPPPTPDNPGQTNHADQAGRISVLITHRLANVRNAHHIVVLNAGRVTATGTHDQLIDTPGDYRDLYQLQARAYQTGN